MNKSYDKVEFSAPFNLALSTLEKIHDILRKIINISALYTLEEEISQGEAQHIKYQLVRQLFIQGIPLYDKIKHKEWKTETYKKIISLESKLKGVRQMSNDKCVGLRPLFDSKVDQELDDVTIDIQEHLQEGGYFMPSRRDPRYAFND